MSRYGLYELVRFVGLVQFLVLVQADTFCTVCIILNQEALSLHFYMHSRARADLAWKYHFALL